MIVKTKYVKASRASAGKASSALKSHLKYLQYRTRDELKESHQDRHLFSQERDQIDRRDVQTDLMAERAGAIYYHRMILSPAENEPVTNWRQWTRDVMGDLEHHLGTDLHWYGVLHRNTDHPHVHVVLRGTGENRETGKAEPVELTPKEFKLLRESGKEHSEYEHYRQLQDTFKALEQLDEQERLFDQERTLIRQEPAHGFDR